MKQILIIGAGRSSYSLIKYLEKNAAQCTWQLTVADKSIDLIKEKANDETRAVELDIFDEIQLTEEVRLADIVISMLPARMHFTVALECLKQSKSLLTASYVSDELMELDAEVKSKGLLFLNELGVDPGIDHMSAMQLIDSIDRDKNEILGFETFTGGLIAPESDNNPWHYKFTWNPRNVVLAGHEGPAKFIQEGKYKYIPYNRLFRRTERIEIEGFGKFEGYANRDSLKYIDKYKLQGVPTVYRGTLRRPGYCKAWDVFVQLGLTDDSYVMENTEDMTYREFINSFLYYSKEDSVELKLYHYMHIDQDSTIRDKLKWLGIFENEKIGLKRATPAQILQKLLMKKWHFEEHDKDMIVMWHKLIYKNKENGKTTELTSSMGLIGDAGLNTAMSQTVGLPLAIAAKMVLSGQIALTGVHIPNKKEIYTPILKELKKYRIEFKEKKSLLN
jgi:saccharopine dehydrogenase-like NADP-dependent oxidoreductase